MTVLVKKSNRSPATTAVACHSSDGTTVHARPLRLTRLAVTFEFSTPECVIRNSEVLRDLQIVVQDKIIYSGRGVVRSVVDAGTKIVCEATLDETGWKNLETTLKTAGPARLHDEFKQFVAEWQKLYKVLPQYKTIVADMHTFLTDLRLWIEQVELALCTDSRKSPHANQNQIVEELAKYVFPCVDALFEKFEAVAARVESDLAPVHYMYIRRQLHPIVLCTPFLHRAFYKPLGYAGDYKTVIMIALNQPSGTTLFAKLLDEWFLRQPPTQGHRNRLAHFEKQLAAETTRAVSAGRNARILSIGCGPAWEAQQFIRNNPLSNKAEFTLVDFNHETLEYVKNTLNDLKKQYGRQTKFEVVQLSAQELLHQKRLHNTQIAQKQFDYVYCGGLFDYLPDNVCKRLIKLLYEWLAPGGLLTVTNLDPSNPSRSTMEHIADWHLIYRTRSQLLALIPEHVVHDQVRVLTDATGTNLILQLRKQNEP